MRRLSYSYSSCNLQIKPFSPHILYHQKLSRQESYSASILEHSTLTFNSRKSQGHVDYSATTDPTAIGRKDIKSD